MKRTLSCILAMLLVSILCACGTSDMESAPVTESPLATEVQTPVEIAVEAPARESIEDVEVIHCHFTKELTPLDGEAYYESYTERTDKVYVDLLLCISNNTAVLSETDFSGYVFYNDARFDLQYELEVPKCTGFASTDKDSIAPGQGGLVHLFTLLTADAAKDTSLEVVYTVGGQEATVPVDAMDTRNQLERKIQLAVGQSASCNSMDVTVELLESSFKKYLTASDKVNSEQYTYGSFATVTFGGSGEPDPFAECVLKITNNSSADITYNDIASYVLTDEGRVQSDIYMEVDNNTDLTSDFTIAAGATELLHMVNSAIYETDSEDVRIMRFNIAGTVFYCTIGE